MFQIGDIVKIKERFERPDDRPGINDHMIKFKGETTIIRDIDFLSGDITAYMLDIDNQSWKWADRWLKKATLDEAFMLQIKGKITKEEYLRYVKKTKESS